MGPRKKRPDGKTEQSYRNDQVSATYQRVRAKLTVHAEAAARLRADRARSAASRVVATHGFQFVVEDCGIAAWQHAWGAPLAAFAPAMLLAAIDREAREVAKVAAKEGGVIRASTKTTALSQHCPCGARVPKRLADRIHVCATCGLRGDRDAVSAVLASFVVHGREKQPASARVDYEVSVEALGEIRRALRAPYSGWQDTLSESTDRVARDGAFIVWRQSSPDSVAVARRNVGTASCSTRNETGSRQTTFERARVRTDMFIRCGAYVARLTNTS
jgi:hypothetical protein